MKKFKIKQLFSWDKWKVTINGDDALEDLFDQKITYFTLCESVTLNDYIIFWYNKRLYIVNNDNFRYQSNIDPNKLKLIKNNVTFRVLFNGSYSIWERPMVEIDNTDICYCKSATIIYIPKSLKEMKFKINPILERVLFLYLKFKFLTKHII